MGASLLFACFDDAAGRCSWPLLMHQTSRICKSRRTKVRHHTLLIVFPSTFSNTLKTSGNPFDGALLLFFQKRNRSLRDRRSSLFLGQVLGVTGGKLDLSDKGLRLSTGVGALGGLGSFPKILLTLPRDLTSSSDW